MHIPTPLIYWVHIPAPLRVHCGKKYATANMGGKLSFLVCKCIWESLLEIMPAPWTEGYQPTPLALMDINTLYICKVDSPSVGVLPVTNPSGVIGE